jgi:hypothetical protein
MARRKGNMGSAARVISGAQFDSSPKGGYRGPVATQWVGPNTPKYERIAQRNAAGQRMTSAADSLRARREKRRQAQEEVE